ncbi:MAG: adenylyltransferase/cytidyltransferase family protein [Chthoniobacterales bacterium]
MHEGRVVDAGSLAAVREEMDRAGHRLVFTNGCFDLLHVGHVRYLRQARALGDALAVGLNSDSSVRELKGEGRPVNPQDDRAEVLAALGCVDYVVIFDGKRATDLLRAVRPHVYAKGGDYSVDSLDAGEREALRAAGAEIRILPLVPGRSTTAVLARSGAR